jgi:hypothetical protein
MTKQITTSASSLPPLRAGYNSIVPDLTKWRQFDHELNAKRKLQHQLAHDHQYWRSHVLKQWHLVLNKLHLRSVE